MDEVRIRLQARFVAWLASGDDVDQTEQVVVSQVGHDGCRRVVADDGDFPAGVPATPHDLSSVRRRRGGHDGFHLDNAQCFLNLACEGRKFVGDVAEHVEGVAGARQVAGHLLAVTGKNRDEALRRFAVAEPGEDTADGSVEVEQNGDSPAEDAPKAASGRRKR
nr:hypothetical protein [Streptoalloteichus hindustanus]